MENRARAHIPIRHFKKDIKVGQIPKVMHQVLLYKEGKKTKVGLKP